MEDAFLRTDERLNLRLRIEIHVVPTLVEVGHCLAQFWRTHRGLIAVGVGLMGHLTEFLHGLW